jgi:hypothetical protein
MPGMTASAVTASEKSGTTVTIGGLPIRIASASRPFIQMLEARYAGFLTPPANEPIRIDVEVVPPARINDEDEVQVRRVEGRWVIRRGDFIAEWNPATGRCSARQTANPYALDSILRIIHSLVLAESGGFLLHSASAMRNGRAFLFSGVSGAGKTTISSLAPSDVTLLTDEVSYIRHIGDGYQAFGTPFAGDLATPGDNIAAPIACLYLLAKGRENRIGHVAAAPAARMLLRNILFFAEDPQLVNGLFRSACEFVSRVPVFELTFRPDAAVWDLIQ